MPADYTSLSSSLARTRERSGASSTDNAYLTELLELSFGIDPANNKQYRPFYCAAKFLEQNRSIQALSEADGAKFTGQAKTIASLLALQNSVDQALQLTIRPGFEAAAVKTFRLQGTRSHPTQARP